MNLLALRTGGRNQASHLDQQGSVTTMPSTNQSAFAATAFQSETSPLEINPPRLTSSLYADSLSTSQLSSSSFIDRPGLPVTDPAIPLDGSFTVGSTGQVRIDYLFDGGGYQGELAIFSLSGLDFTTDLSTLTSEIARRALSDTVQGHVVIQDTTEGARFSGELGEANQNSGDYRGVKTFTMTAGDLFGVILAPNGTIAALQNNSNPHGVDRPLFSLVGLNPAYGFQVGQIADVDGNGSTFVLEDLRVDEGSDRDYNDIIFQVRGAIGSAVGLDKVIDPVKDWRNTSTAKDLLSYISDSNTEFPFLTQRIWQDAGNRAQLLSAFSQSNDPRFSPTVEILRDVALKDQPDLDELNAALTAQKASLVDALQDPANAAVLRSLQTNVVAYTPGFDAPDGTTAQVFTSTVERYGGIGYVGNPTGGVVRFGAGYIQTFDSGGAGTGAILYGDGYAQGVFLAGQEWQEFQAQGGVLAQGYPTENKPPSSDGGTVIALPPTDISLPAPTESQPNASTAQPLNAVSTVIVSASPTYRNLANGNSYLLTSADTWAGAQRQAVASGGNLVTINDRAEQDWLVSTFGRNPVWIGLTDSELYGTTEGNFRWVSGEPVTFTNWYPGAPDNVTVATATPRGEDFVQMNFDSGNIPGRWNDLPDGYDPIANRVWNLFGITEIPDRTPVVTATNQTVLPGVSISPSFSVTDPEDDSIQFYAFYDSNDSSISGYFTVNGVKQAAGQIIYVPANQLSTVRFVGGSVPGDDGILTAAYDGYRWGNWSSSNVNTDTAGNTLGSARSLTLGQSLIEYTSQFDLDDFYRFTISDRTRVNLSISGLSSDADLYLQDAAGTVIGSSTLGGNVSDSVTQELNPGTYYIRVNRFSGATSYTLSTSGQIVQTNRPPIVTASNQTVNPGQAILPVSSASDPDGNPITSYRFVDYTNGGGYFTVNGVAQPANQTIEVSAAQLNTVRFVGGTLPGDDSIAISVSDGSLWSNLSNFTIMTDTAGNSVGAARPINLTSSLQSLTEYVSGADSSDFYRFSVTGRTRVELGISGLSADANLQLLDASGTLVAYSYNSGTQPEAITRDVDTGTYYVQVNRSGGTGGTSYNFNYRGTAVASGPQFTSFSVSDASGDGTANAVFQQGALRTAWTTNVLGSSVEVFAQNTSTGAITKLTSNNGLINLYAQQLTAGNYNFYAEARDASGNVGRSTEVPIRVLEFNRINANSVKLGDFKDGTQVFSNSMTDGSVFIGRGGTDILDFSSIPYSGVTFDSTRRTVFGGTTFDWLRVNSTGQEVYFQGYESLKFADQIRSLSITPNDPLFSQQWNLRMADIPGAWRFTTGSSSVLIGNVDSGINSHSDINQSRIIPYSSQADDDSSGNWRGHGTGVQGIMAATANNGVGLAGINWNSQTYVIDVGNASDSLDSTTALSAAGNYAQQTGQRVVVNNSWSYPPGSNLIPAQGDAMNNAAYRGQALYVFASGNDDVNPVNSPARWSEQLSNVVAVGAVDSSGKRMQKGLAASFVTDQSYTTYPLTWGSNYGNGLTVVAPTMSPSTHIDGGYYSSTNPFSGTSAAAPNASGIASLIWSANTGLTSSDIRNIMTGTANHSFGWFNTNEYGAGIVDAEAAVRRADALGRSNDVASLFNNAGLFFG